MEKQKKWQFFLILAVLALTIYNILPTVFYYCKPLKSPINQTQADEIATSIEKRVHQLESESISWLSSFCELLNVKPQSITPDSQNLRVTFAKSEEAAKFRRFLPRAGSLIPFVPAQLSLAPQEENSKEVIVQRHVSTHLDKNFFAFAPKDSALYRELMIDRAAQIAYALAGPSEAAYAISSQNPRYLETLASQINSISDMTEVNKTVSNRYAAGFTQGPFADRPAAIQALVTAFDAMRDELKGKAGLEKKEMLFINAENFLKKHQSLFASGQEPLNIGQIKAALSENNTLALGNRNPLFSELVIDWTSGQILLKLHSDFNPARMQQPLINEVAKVTRITNEAITPNDGIYTIGFHDHPDTSGYLALNLEKIGETAAEEIHAALKNNWRPNHPDLQNLEVVDSISYETLPAEQKALSLVIHKPSDASRSLFIVAKGIDQILHNYEQFPDSEPAQTFNADFRTLASLLQQKGFHGFRSPNGDLVFERSDLHRSLLAATRENFEAKGTQKWATLELSNLEQRLLVANQIDTQIHEDLIKWRDEFNAAQVSMQPGSRFDVPKPTRSVFLSNLALTASKFFRGDEKKVIRWGLDLSGGKTVQIELRDANNRLVKNEEDIKQGINELYTRVNKMGVSEVVIRQLGNNIVLDFPGSQSLSAAELIKASSMYFHVVNEKFSIQNPNLAETVNRFLQEVWNEAVVTNRKDTQSINAIAWSHLHGDTVTEAAHALLDNGLNLQPPTDPSMDNSLEDTFSKIALMRGDASEWHNQTHPLLVVFRNYALEGARLENIQANYDPQKGNYLSFEVQKGNARSDLQAWTSRYSKERVLGTALEDCTPGRGWRMAVVLNDTIISAPTLDAVIRDSASISGSFSQREVNQLASDLKAGSLTFTPHILSEKNVSPELGEQDRVQGITATVVALLLVIASMITYYRYAGLVASVAVLFNLLILWATLQNIGATLSLAGIAGIILTVGMAVDANVLVFERVKEEFALTGKISTAIAAGYQKAYSAIIDSNVTTVIAALILLNFDAGPIKGFAITLIIGIVSSMFTALFMTRYYFNGWVQNPKHRALTMANWVQAKSINFLKQAKLAFSIALAIILVGGYFLYAQRATIFGMDFTGGFSMHLAVEPRAEENYIQSVEQAFIANGASNQDFQIRELNPTNHLRILFGTSMEQPGKPFHNMPVESEMQTNPRIDWVVDALELNGLALTPASLAQLDANWTAMSGQMSDSMRNNALIGLLISFICIFIYIAFRFEYKFAAAAILCLLHDVLITLGLMGLLHALGVPVQIDLNTVAAIMTIVGYSLNDTIIIFDRIREEISTSRNKPLSKVVNSALNATLSRTTITSGTTLLVLIALVALGGSSIFSFALVMTIGVFFGTLSSWYIASPLMLFFHGREEAKERGLVKDFI
jgi:SecD/SecF fusion protein